MNSWVSKWAKSNYPTAKNDLCTCFFERGQVLAEALGYISMITASSWMFISSFEKFRKRLLSRGSICSMIQQSTHGYAGVTVPTTMFVYACNRSGIIGSYIRLEDFDRPQWQEPRALEALADPDCGWFYRADADGFDAIPGSPIAYWASEAVQRAFLNGERIASFVKMPYGFKTGENDRFLRFWWECSHKSCTWSAKSRNDAIRSGAKWFPYNKGGAFRKWFGNNEYVLNYKNGGEEVIAHAQQENRSAANYDAELLFRPAVTWSRISSGRLHMRYSPRGAICDMTGPGYFGDPSTLSFLQAFCNSSVAASIAGILSPTLDYQPGQIGNYPVSNINELKGSVVPLVDELRCCSKNDWDSFETSWDFKRHSLA